MKVGTECLADHICPACVLTHGKRVDEMEHLLRDLDGELPATRRWTHGTLPLASPRPQAAWRGL
jgi:hypothetical protein